MRITPDDQLLPLAELAAAASMTAAHLRLLASRDRLTLVRPNRNFYVTMREAKRFLGIEDDELGG